MGDKIIYFDVETTKLENKKAELVSFPYLVGWTLGDSKFNFAFDRQMVTIFLVAIEKILQKSQSRSVIMNAYNLYYDISVLRPILNQKWKGRINLHLDHKKTFIFGDYKFRIKGIEYTIFFEDYWIFDRNMKLEDWMMRLKNKKKRYFDYDKWGLPQINTELQTMTYKNYEGIECTVKLSEELAYLHDDVMILPQIGEYIKKFKEQIVKVTGVDVSYAQKMNIKPGLTVASFAKYIVSLYMRRKFDNVFRPIVSEKMYKFQHRSFMGGYTFGNKDILQLDCQGKLEMCGVDITAAYAHVISEGIPRGKLLDTPKTSDDIEWYVITTENPKLKEKYAFLSELPINEELMDGKAWLCTKKLYLMLIEFFQVAPVVKTIYYSEKTYAISGMMKKLFKERQTAKPDTITYHCTKYLMNTIFGKFCEKPHIEKYELNEDGLERIVEDDPIYRSILGGIYIANESRVRMLESIMISVKDNNTIIYGDTDSLVFRRKFPSGLNLGKGFGQWRIEGVYHFFSRPNVMKKYIFEGINAKSEKFIKIAFSGFDNRIPNYMTVEQRRLLFSPDVNVLWKRAKNQGRLNSLNQIVIIPMDLETNSEIPVTHELVQEGKKFILTKYESVN